MKEPQQKNYFSLRVESLLSRTRKQENATGNKGKVNPARKYKKPFVHALAKTTVLLIQTIF